MEAFCEFGDGADAFRNPGDGREAADHGRKAMGDERNGFCDVGGGGKALGDGEKLFYEVGACESALGGGGNAFREVGDGEKQGWVSPRISFSKDFAMVDMDTLSNGHSSGSRVSPEKRKWEQQDDYSAEFEFLKKDSGYGASDQAKDFMLSADELFSDGKLLPLPFRNNRAASDDLCLPCTSDHHHHQQVELSLHKSHNRLMARHLSFEISRPSFSSSSSFSRSHFSFESFSCTSSPSRVSPCDPSPSTAPVTPIAFSASSSLPSSSSSASLPSSSSSSASLPSSSSSSSKYSIKFKDFFKSKRVFKDISPSQLTRDNSTTTSICRLPISPRSFWPFSRSNSAGENNNTTPPPLPCRSNSAGESNTNRTSFVAKRSDGLEGPTLCSTSTSESLKMQDAGPMASGHEGSPTQSSMPFEVGAECTLESWKHLDQSTNIAADTFQDAMSSRVISGTTRMKGSGSSSKVSRKKASSSSGSFARGSPGRRRGALNSPGVKANVGKIMLRNLERCSADKTLSREGSKGLHRRGPYPVAARVSPVLNVAIYRGRNTPKIGIFGFGSLFSFKKETKPVEAAINWRKGA